MIPSRGRIILLPPVIPALVLSLLLDRHIEVRSLCSQGFVSSFGPQCRIHPRRSATLIPACVPSFPLSASFSGRAWHRASVLYAQSRRAPGSVRPQAEQTSEPVMQMSGWASPTWNWGFAVGDAHNEAMRVRQQLSDSFDGGDVGAMRRAWLVDMVGGSSAVGWEDVKLVLALKWQKASYCI